MVCSSYSLLLPVPVLLACSDLSSQRLYLSRNLGIKCSFPQHCCHPHGDVREGLPQLLLVCFVPINFAFWLLFPAILTSGVSSLMVTMPLLEHPVANWDFTTPSFQGRGFLSFLLHVQMHKIPHVWLELCFPSAVVPEPVRIWKPTWGHTNSSFGSVHGYLQRG